MATTADHHEVERLETERRRLLHRLLVMHMKAAGQEAAAALAAVRRLDPGNPAGLLPR
jgi:hypothetical protein